MSIGNVSIGNAPEQNAVLLRNSTHTAHTPYNPTPHSQPPNPTKPNLTLLSLFTHSQPPITALLLTVLVRCDLKRLLQAKAAADFIARVLYATSTSHVYVVHNAPFKKKGLFSCCRSHSRHHPIFLQRILMALLRGYPFLQCWRQLVLMALRGETALTTAVIY